MWAGLYSLPWTKSWVGHNPSRLHVLQCGVSEGCRCERCGTTYIQASLLIPQTLEEGDIGLREERENSCGSLPSPHPHTSGVPGTTSLEHKGALRTPLGASMYGGERKANFSLWRGPEPPTLVRKEGSGIISLSLDRLRGQWPGQFCRECLLTWG